MQTKILVGSSENYYLNLRNSNQAGAAQDSKPKFGSFYDSFYNANCSPDNFNKMVMCQNNLIEVADKCYDSRRDEICQLKCSEHFYKSIEGRCIWLMTLLCNIEEEFDFLCSECPCRKNVLWLLWLFELDLWKCL